MSNKQSPSGKMQPSMKILIADDHWVVRESLKQVMRQLSQDCEPVEASNFSEALNILEQDPTIGLMLIDLVMPGFHEFEGIQQLRSQYPAIPIVVVSIHEEPEHILKAISHGVIGYIPKSATADEIIQSLTRVISGEVAFPRGIIQQSGLGNAPVPTQPKESSASNNLGNLTGRERDVLALVGEATPVSQVALKLKISPQTVRVHLSNAMRKLNLKNKEEAIHFAVNNAQQLASRK